MPRYRHIVHSANGQLLGAFRKGLRLGTKVSSGRIYPLKLRFATIAASHQGPTPQFQLLEKVN
jgi:hypothetical protein